jgi:drug/metabolite transporter (DMT)-like permease
MQKRRKGASTADILSRSSQRTEIGSRKRYEGIILLVLFSIISSSVGIFVKIISGMSVYQIIFFRAMLALSLIIFVLIVKKNLKELLPEKIFLTLLMGIFEGISILAFFKALETSTLSDSIFLAYSAPVWSIIFAYIFLKEKIEKKTVISMLIAILGILLIVDPRNLSLSFQLGNIYALISGIFYAAMAIAAKPILEKKSGYYAAFWQYTIIAIIFGLFSGFSFTGASDNMPALLGLGIFATGASAILFMEGIKKIKGQEIFIITSLEPVFASILAFFILGEKMEALAVLGGILIIIGIHNLSKKYA